MLELIQITNDAAFARRCDAVPGMRLMVDLERHGKAQRQAGRNTFISDHEATDVARIKAQLTRSRLMVRVNPLHGGTHEEADAVLAQGADLLMLPMFSKPRELREFSEIVAGRAGIVALLEQGVALDSMDEWMATPGLAEVYLGLNDLHLSLGLRFMFEPLASGIVDRVAQAALGRGLRFGFGGIARMQEGLLSGQDVLAEHLRIGSGAVILSRTFHRGGTALRFEDEIASLRAAERLLGTRSEPEEEADRRRIAGVIEAIAAGAAARA